MTDRRRGSALLAVLWLAAALTAIAFSVALLVRGETERVSTGDENLRAYYLAQGAIQRAILHMQWASSANQPDGVNPYFVTGQSQMLLNFPSGQAQVDVIPEASKLDLNTADPVVLGNLMMALGAAPDQAELIAAGIVDWRRGNGPGQLTPFDQYYLSLSPSFHAPHASFQEVEALLNLQGMTPELFYGTWVRQAVDGGGPGETRLMPRGGVRDCVSVFGSITSFDASWVKPAVLAANGVSADEIQAVLAFQQSSPVHSPTELAALSGQDQTLASHLSLAPHTIFTLRATARLRHPDGSLSDLTRTVSALVKLMPAGSDQTFNILRWYDRG
jgi:general secretion pathway protein K